MNPSTELDARARALHTWWNQATGQDAKLTMGTLTQWMDLLGLDHNGQEIRRVLLYLRREIAAGRRNHGCLALRNFLVPENFQKDLALANMIKSNALDPEKRLAKTPDADPSTNPQSQTSNPQLDAERAAASKRLSDWRKKTGL